MMARCTAAPSIRWESREEFSPYGSKRSVAPTSSTKHHS